MAFPDSSSLAPVFIDSEPDWGQPISVLTQHFTDIQSAREGSEQRARRRVRPRYSISFIVPGLATLDYSIRKAKALKEVGRPVVVPIWTAWLALSSMTTVDRAALGVTLALKKFKAASWAYFVQAGKVSTFRRITAVGSNFIDLHATDAFPVPPIPAFTAGAAVYPCVLGRRAENSCPFIHQRVNLTDEPIFAEEL